MHFSLIFHPTSLNSKNRTIDNGPNVSNITFKLEITVADVCDMADIKMIAKIHFFLKIILSVNQHVSPFHFYFHTQKLNSFIQSDTLRKQKL